MTADEVRDRAIAEVAGRSDNPAVASAMAHVLATTEGDPRRALTCPQRFFVLLLSRGSGIPEREAVARYDRENAALIVREADDERWSRLQVAVLLAQADEVAERVAYSEWIEAEYGTAKDVPRPRGRGGKAIRAKRRPKW